MCRRALRQADEYRLWPPATITSPASPITAALERNLMDEGNVDILRPPNNSK